MLALAPPRMIQLGPREARLKSSDQTTPMSYRSQSGARLATRSGLEKKLAPVQRRTRRRSGELLLAGDRINHIRFAVAANGQGDDGELVAGQEVGHIRCQSANRGPIRIDAEHLVGRAALNVPKALGVPARRGAISRLEQVDVVGCGEQNDLVREIHDVIGAVEWSRRGQWFAGQAVRKLKALSSDPIGAGEPKRVGGGGNLRAERRVCIVGSGGDLG